MLLPSLERIYCKIWANETYNEQSRNFSFLIKGHFLAFRGLASSMKLYFCIPHDPVYQLYNYQLEMNDLPVRGKCVWIIRQYILMLITTAQWKITNGKSNALMVTTTRTKTCRNSLIKFAVEIGMLDGDVRELFSLRHQMTCETNFMPPIGYQKKRKKKNLLSRLIICMKLVSCDIRWRHKFHCKQALNTFLLPSHQNTKINMG